MTAAGMPHQLAEYLEWLGKYRQELQSALENEQAKRRALLQGNLDKLETVLQMQQAQTMRLRSMEEHRVKLQQALGGQEQTAGQFAQTIADKSVRQSFLAEIAQMKELVELIKEQNRQSLELAKSNMELLDRVLQRQSAVDASKVTYSPDSGKKNTYSSGSSFQGSF